MTRTNCPQSYLTSSSNADKSEQMEFEAGVTSSFCDTQIARESDGDMAKSSVMYHSPIRRTFKFENNFSIVGKSFLNLVKW